MRSINFYAFISMAIAMGNTNLLIENISEPIPLILKQLIERKIIKKDNLLVNNLNFFLEIKNIIN